MKKLLILIMLFMVVFSFTALAERYVEYEFKEAFFDQNGDFIETNEDVDDVNVIGFVCDNKDCSDVRGTIFNGEVLNSGRESNEITLIYPTRLQSRHGYAVYKFKEGYLPWESNPTWQGTRGSDPKGPYTDYLTKIEACSAPIDKFSVVNDAEAHIPLVIDVSASLDAVVQSAVKNAGPVDYIPDMLRDDYYSIKTLVILTIKKENGGVVHRDSVELLIPFGKKASDVSFTWTPEDDGRYKATVTTEVIDDKCESSVDHETAKEFHVLEEYPRGMCYTLLQNMDLSNEFPEEGDDLRVSVGKISNYANNETTVSLKPIATDLSFEIYGEDGELVHENSRRVEANDNVFDYKRVNFNWNVPTDLVSGLYKMVITGVGRNKICGNIDNLADTISTTVFVKGDGGPGNDAPQITSDPITLAFEGLRYRYDVEAIDVDGDRITFKLLQAPQGMTIKTDTGLIEWKPKNSDLGDHQIVIEASDGSLQDTQVYILHVLDQDSEEAERERDHEFSISGLILSQYKINPDQDDSLEVYVKLSNRGRRNENSIKVEAVILEVGDFSLPRVVNLGKVENSWVFLELGVPEGLERGDYVVKVVAENDDFRDVRFDSFSVR